MTQTAITIAPRSISDAFKPFDVIVNGDAESPEVATAKRLLESAFRSYEMAVHETRRANREAQEKRDRAERSAQRTKIRNALVKMGIKVSSESNRYGANLENDRWGFNKDGWLSLTEGWKSSKTVAEMHAILKTQTTLEYSLDVRDEDVLEYQRDENGHRVVDEHGNWVSRKTGTRVVLSLKVRLPQENA